MNERELPPAELLKLVNERGVGYLPGLIGIVFTEMTPELIRAELPIRPDLLAPNGFLHAATVIALADTACGYGCRLLLPETASGFTTIELKSNFLGTALSGTIQCEATPVHAGRTTQVWDAEVRNAEGRRMALFRCTQAVLYARS
ncbi:PaaI family thioesterase [Deinococcus sp.]|uniref:PaaI family thioesterase n=1 Tax=Deinococcus sp. TaxID=47478 RepID=UPI003CC6A5CC